MTDKTNELLTVLEYYDIPIQFMDKFKVVCPFHGDINASLLVDALNAKWFCFGCQQGGDAKDFVKKMENCNDIKAYMKLESIKSGNKKKSKKIKNIEIKQQEQEDRDFVAESEDYYFNLTTIDWKKSKKYGAQKEKEYLRKRGFSSEALNDCGCKITYNDSYPIIFPIFDLGEFKGYVCRTMNKEIEQKRKYLYNKGFTRRNTLVGNYRCKTVMVVEGYMDYLKARQFGVKYVCALLGWKATREQIEKLKKAGVKNIISALDNDKYGKKGTEFLKSFFEVAEFCYPEHLKDIGEMNFKQFEKYRKRTIENRRNKNGSVKRHEKRNSKIRRK